jgi:multidrug efflux pump
VTAYYEGTAPEEMEKLVTIPLEEQLADVEGLKEVRSTSGENASSLVIEFVAGEDIEQAKQRVKDKVDLAKPDLPADLDEPAVDAFNFSSDYPVYIFALSGATEPELLKNLARTSRTSSNGGACAAPIWRASGAKSAWKSICRG